MPSLIAFSMKARICGANHLSTRSAAMEKSIGANKLLLPSRKLAANGLGLFTSRSAGDMRDWWRRIFPLHTLKRARLMAESESSSGG